MTTNEYRNLPKLGGILSSVSTMHPSDSDQNFWALIRQNSAEVERKRVSNSPRPGIQFGNIAAILTAWQNFDLESRLIAFALEKKISLKNENWRLNTLLVAAYEHPKLQRTIRKRGRPKKAAFVGLLATTPLLDPKAKALLEDIEALKAMALADHDKILSDRQAAKYYVLRKELELLEARNCPLPIDKSEFRRIIAHPTFVSNWRTIQNKIVKARKIEVSQ